MMKQLIEGFSSHLREAVEVGRNTKINNTPTKIDNILLLGLGGSGIGANIVQALNEKKLNIPFEVRKTYDIPAWVSSNTLFIASSFSGTTEETLAGLEEAAKAGAQIACITSGGALLEIALQRNYNYIKLPVKANCPRGHLGFSLVALHYILSGYGLIPYDYEQTILETADFLDSIKEKVLKDAEDYANLLTNRIPILYADNLIYPVLVRFQQQVNENSKQFCHVNVFPEMNHNELVGWVFPDQFYKQTAVMLFETDFDHPRVVKRMKFCKDIFAGKTDGVHEIMAKGKNLFEQMMYLVNLTDWISWFLARNNNIDPFPVDIINILKSELQKK